MRNEELGMRNGGKGNDRVVEWGEGKGLLPKSFFFGNIE